MVRTKMTTTYSPSDEEIVNWIRQEGSVKAEDVWLQFGGTQRAIKIQLNLLKRRNLLVCTQVRNMEGGWRNEWKAIPGKM